MRARKKRKLVNFRDSNGAVWLVYWVGSSCSSETRLSSGSFGLEDFGWTSQPEQMSVLHVSGILMNSSIRTRFTAMPPCPMCAWASTPAVATHVDLSVTFLAGILSNYLVKHTIRHVIRYFKLLLRPAEVITA
jgi:hypothetical protein